MDAATPLPPPLNFKLTRYEGTGGSLLDEAEPKATTPNEWFARKFPTQTEEYGPAMMEGETRVETAYGSKTNIVPVALNNDFMAAVLGGDPELGHHVVYYLPEQTFYFYDCRLGYYAPTTEPKLLLLLSQYLIRCATEMPADTVAINHIFLYMRQEERLRVVVRKARSLLAAGPDFFTGTNGHKRILGGEVIDPTTIPSYVLFAREGLLPGDQPLMTVPALFDAYTRYCQLHDLKPVERLGFKSLVADVIREEYGIPLRRDLKDERGKFQQGWKNLVALPLQESPQPNPNQP